MTLGTQEGVWLHVAGHRVALHVVELGLACCGVEVRAARRLMAATAESAADPVPGEGASAELPELHVLVVAGTVTARLAPDLQPAFAALPEPRAVLAFGACTATGGPYWDSYCVVPGAQEVVPIDVWVAGCPPRPQDLIAGLEEVLRGRA
jgi:NADH-quinone oxidoreductase subunit B